MPSAIGVSRQLDTLQPVQSRVGYGHFGTGGSLGYEGKQVTVGGTTFTSALSTHPPARLLYHLGGAAMRFRCRVAINNDGADADPVAHLVAVDPSIRYERLDASAMLGTKRNIACRLARGEDGTKRRVRDLGRFSRIADFSR
jgi:hypothetical protein